LIGKLRTSLRRRRLTRTAQIGFVCVLIVCVVQTLWWVVDTAYYTDEVRIRLTEMYDQDIAAAESLHDRGAAPAEIRALFPHLEVMEVEGRLVIDDSHAERLASDRRRHLFQYGSEGAFFILVLVTGMWVISLTLRQRRDLLRRQENFIAAVSHELKNPLASIKLSAETLELREVSDEKRAQLSGRMLREVDRLEAMVSNLLSVARLDEGHMKLEKEPVQLSRMLRGLLDSDAFHAGVHGIDVVLNMPEDLTVQADPRAVQTVLSNLTDNAVKSVVAAAGKRVEIRARADGDEVRVDVEDDGLGFDAAQREQLFSKFYRTGEELRRKTQGAGLGLYIVKQFMELENGRVEAASDGPERGARFTVWWPANGGGRSQS